MKRITTTTLVGLSLAAAAPAAAGDISQLIAGAGLSRGEAAALTLNEIAALKSNRGADSDERQAIAGRSAAISADPARHAQLIAAAGLTAAEAKGMTLAELAARKHNAETDAGDHQGLVAARGGAVAGAQLVASAGLSPSEAKRLSLAEVAAAKFERDGQSDY